MLAASSHTNLQTNGSFKNIIHTVGVTIYLISVYDGSAKGFENLNNNPELLMQTKF
jgi:hypothetical protein